MNLQLETKVYFLRTYDLITNGLSLETLVPKEIIKLESQQALTKIALQTKKTEFNSS